MERPTENNIESVSGQVDNQKFVYKKSGIDIGVVLIFILTIVVFGMIYYVTVYFDERDELANVRNDSRYQELIDQRDNLQKQLDQYRNDADLNRDN